MSLWTWLTGFSAKPSKPDPAYVTPQQLQAALEPLRKALMSTQADADALLAQLQQDEVNIHAVAQAAADAAASVSAKLDALAAQVAAGEAIDLTEVQAEAQNLTDAIAPLADAVSAIGEETPNPPPPPAG